MRAATFRRTRAASLRGAAAWVAATLCLGCGSNVRGAGVEAFPDEPDFLRFVEATAETGERLETPILSYADERGRRVDLVSVVHVAELAYYEELNRRFEAYDAVLYELVAERGARPGPGGASAGLLSFFQTALKDLLALEFQLDRVDYSPVHFVHADVSPDELDALFAERGDSLFASLLRAALRSAQAGEAGVPTFALLAALFAEDSATELKRVLARAFEDVERVAAGFEDESGTSVLVTARNERAMEVLAEELVAGRERLAIFYGAAHMDDFHERLVAQGFVGQSAEWLAAWSITGPRE